MGAIEFDKISVKKYLDNAIESWRNTRDDMSNSKEKRLMAIYYIDAFQSVRTSFFGALLKEDKERSLE